jgi:hypothetical protein
VLITGGAPIDDGRVLNNPNLRRDECRPNAFIVEVPPAADRAQIRLADVPEAAKPLLKRALHEATPLQGGRVLVSGGWAVFHPPGGSAGIPTAIFAGDEVLTYRDAAGPGAGTFDVPGYTLSVPRLGHVAWRADDGTVVLAGGLFRDASANEPDVARTGEVYMPPAPAGVCRAP